MKCKNTEDVKSLLVRVMKYSLRKDPAGMINTLDSYVVIVAQNVATSLWLKKAKETEDTIELRRQLNCLNKSGVWAFVSKEE